MQRVRTFTAGIPVASADMNAIQDDAAPINNYSWLGRPPDVWCADGSTINIDPHNGFVVPSVQCTAFASTTVASGSNGMNLPQSIINVVSTAGFVSAGKLIITIGGVPTTVTYTGTSGGNQFTGCTGGSGTLGTGDTVAQDPTVMTTTGLSPSTWYYIYGYNIGSLAAPLIAYEYSTVAPDTTKSTKTGDSSRKYITCFFTWSSATTIVCFRKASTGLYLYSTLDAHAGTAPYVVLSGGNATAYTTKSCANAVPPHVRNAHMMLGLVGSTSSATTSSLQANGSTGTLTISAGTIESNNAANKYYTWADIDLDSSQELQYKLTNPGTLDITVQGFDEAA